MQGGWTLPSAAQGKSSAEGRNGLLGGKKLQLPCPHCPVFSQAVCQLPAFLYSRRPASTRVAQLTLPLPAPQGVECYGSYPLGCQPFSSQAISTEDDVQHRANQLYGQPLKMQACPHDGWRTCSCLADHLRFVANLQEPCMGPLLGPLRQGPHK